MLIQRKPQTLHAFYYNGNIDELANWMQSQCGEEVKLMHRRTTNEFYVKQANEGIEWYPPQSWLVWEDGYFVIMDSDTFAERYEASTLATKQ